MPAKKTTSKTKKQPVRHDTVPTEQLPKNALLRWFFTTYQDFAKKTRGLLERRPHRSFRRTRRRDYNRSLKLPGYWAFTNHVRKTLWQHKKLFFWLIVIYAVLTVALVGLASQDTYTQLSDTLRQTSGDVFKGNWGAVGQAGLLLATGVTGDLNTALTQAQQIYATIIVFFTWLTSVWLLRAIVAGRKPKLRDALYNAGAPILPTFLVGALLAVQLLPIVVAVLGFSALTPFGILDGGIESMVFWGVAFLLVLLSFYWVTSTLIALVVVTLPGMYPMQAIRAAGDIVIGRRLRLLLRFVWLLLILALSWAIIMVPIILFDAWLKGVFSSIAWVPIIPVALLILGTVTVVWMAGYVYLLYRKVVDDDAAPA